MESVAREFATTSAEREVLLPSGRQSTFYNRVGWAKTYLLKGGLLERTGRGRFRITARGQEELRAQHDRVDARRMLGLATQSPHSEAATALPTTQTPEELLEESYRVLRKRLADELLQELGQRSPRFFERLVIDLLVGMGYGGSREDAAELVGKSGDEGIDGLIKEDRLGLDVVYVQAKRWKATVGRPIVQAFAGSLEGQRARKGVLITTSDFSAAMSRALLKLERRRVVIF
jgi:restriction system protein